MLHGWETLYEACRDNAVGLTRKRSCSGIHGPNVGKRLFWLKSDFRQYIIPDEIGGLARVYRANQGCNWEEVPPKTCIGRTIQMPVQIRLGDSQEDSDPKEGRRERSQFAGAASPSLHVFMDQKSWFFRIWGVSIRGGEGGVFGPNS